ncbi:hypothetical protein GMRT_11023 [Giardia muris]|uniref:Uncharacterized protein n=1 Tax=Giardia muris TaxID=5742 RepID=A0A4Z1SUA1_GIAMU|nr:hypothetical protein GMRT_11023 [Giardia muris]|eukprot:TNJ27188.1 hypothetical protein GMRT_11023 [Giardia muris]
MGGVEKKPRPVLRTLLQFKLVLLHLLRLHGRVRPNRVIATLLLSSTYVGRGVTRALSCLEEKTVLKYFQQFYSKPIRYRLRVETTRQRALLQLIEASILLSSVPVFIQNQLLRFEIRLQGSERLHLFARAYCYDASFPIYHLQTIGIQASVSTTNRHEKDESLLQTSIQDERICILCFYGSIIVSLAVRVSHVNEVLGLNVVSSFTWGLTPGLLKSLLLQQKQILEAAHLDGVECYKVFETQHCYLSAGFPLILLRERADPLLLFLTQGLEDDTIVAVRLTADNQLFILTHETALYFLNPSSPARNPCQFLTRLLVGPARKSITQDRGTELLPLLLTDSGWIAIKSITLTGETHLQRVRLPLALEEIINTHATDEVRRGLFWTHLPGASTSPTYLLSYKEGVHRVVCVVLHTLVCRKSLRRCQRVMTLEDRFLLLNDQGGSINSLSGKMVVWDVKIV